MTIVIYVTITVLILRRSYRSLRSGRTAETLISSVAALVYLLCLFTPAILQTHGEFRSKLREAGVLPGLSEQELDGLLLRWTVELTIVFLAELAMTKRRPQNSDQLLEPCGQPPGLLAVAYVSMVIGISASIAIGAQVEDRGVAGAGVSNLLQSLTVSGLAVLAYYYGTLRRIHRIVLILGLVLLATSYVRSPLVVIAIALAMGAIHRGSLRSRRSIVIAGSAAIVLILMASVMSSLRGAILQDRPSPTAATVQSTISNPLTAPFRAGVDTLDGYRLSRRLSISEPPHYDDPLMAIGSFVPRSLWTSKPEELPVEIGRKYLDYENSGQFLSPVGYLTLVTGGYATGLLGLTILTAGLSAAASRTSGLAHLVVAVIVFRFFIGGAAFDFAYGFRLGAPWLAWWALQRVFRYRQFDRQGPSELETGGFRGCTSQH